MGIKVAAPVEITLAASLPHSSPSSPPLPLAPLPILFLPPRLALPPQTLGCAPLAAAPPAAAARRVFAGMLEARAPPSEATITSLACIFAADAEGAYEAFRLVSSMRQKYGLALCLRSYSPVLATFRRAREAGKAYAVEAHMAASAASPEELELAPLLEDSAKARDADKVYEYMHKLRRAVGCAIEETAKVLEGQFQSEKVATARKAEWDVCQVRTPLRRTTVGAINWGGFGPDHGWCSE